MPPPSRDSCYLGQCWGPLGPPCWHSPSRYPALGAHAVSAATPVQSRMAIQWLMLGLPSSSLARPASEGERCQAIPAVSSTLSGNAAQHPHCKNCSEKALLDRAWDRISLDGVFFYYIFFILKIYCLNSWPSYLEMAGCCMNCCFCLG